MAAQVIRPFASCSSIKSGWFRPANTGDWLICIVPDFIAKFQEASLFFKIWMICRRNGIFQTGMICKSDMKTGYTGVFQQRNKDSKLRFKHTGISIVRIFLTDSQFIIDRKIRQTFAYGLNGFCGKTCTIPGIARRIHPCDD